MASVGTKSASAVAVASSAGSSALGRPKAIAASASRPIAAARSTLGVGRASTTKPSNTPPLVSARIRIPSGVQRSRPKTAATTTARFAPLTAVKCVEPGARKSADVRSGHQAGVADDDARAAVRVRTPAAREPLAEVPLGPVRPTAACVDGPRMTTGLRWTTSTAATSLPSGSRKSAAGGYPGARQQASPRRSRCEHQHRLVSRPPVPSASRARVAAPGSRPRAAGAGPAAAAADRSRWSARREPMPPVRASSATGPVRAQLLADRRRPSSRQPASASPTASARPPPRPDRQHEQQPRRRPATPSGSSRLAGESPGPRIRQRHVSRRRSAGALGTASAGLLANVLRYRRHTVTSGASVSNFLPPSPDTSRSWSTEVKPPCAGAPVDHPLGQHRTDAGQRIELGHRGGVEIDRSRRRRRGPAEADPATRARTGLTARPTISCSPSTSLRGQATFPSVDVAGSTPPAAAIASATREPAGELHQARTPHLAGDVDHDVGRGRRDRSASDAGADPLSFGTATAGAGPQRA